MVKQYAPVTGTTTIPGTVSVGGLTVPSGSQVTITDHFRTRNQFHGFNTGLRGEIKRGMFTFGASGKVAVGHMRQELEINGYTTGTKTPLPGFVALKDDGSTTCASWIYSGMLPAEGKYLLAYDAAAECAGDLGKREHHAADPPFC